MRNPRDKEKKLQLNLNAQRPWITPFVIGVFLLMSVTGGLMFFHLESGLNKAAHEWLGWAMVAGVVAHLMLNVNAFKRHLSSTTGRWVIGACVALLIASFAIPGGGNSKPPFISPIKALAGAPLTEVAQVANLSMAQVRERLGTAGVQAANDNQSVAELVGPDLGDQMRALDKVFATVKPVKSN